MMYILSLLSAGYITVEQSSIIKVKHSQRHKMGLLSGLLVDSRNSILVDRVSPVQL